MKQNKIYPVDWMKWHPYTQTTAADRYYTNIANGIYKILNQKYFQDDSFGETETMQQAACCIAAYFEDVISQIGIWKAFTSECKCLYGKYLPFYWLTNKRYFNDEINVEDVRFLLWHHIQQTRTSSIVNPENPTIELVAQQIYELLEDEYEVAPENEQLQAFFSPDKRYESLPEYRKLLEWFHYHSYLNAFNYNEMNQEVQALIEECADENRSMEFTQMLTLTTASDLCFTSRKNLLSLTSPEWLSLIFGPKYQQATDFSEVKRKKHASYLFNSKDEKFIYVTDMETSEKLCINKASLKTTENLVPNQSIFSSILIFYAGVWNQYGVFILYSEKDKVEKSQKTEEKKSCKQQNERAYNLFMEKNEGVPFTFFKSHEEHQHFITHVLGFGLPDDYRLPKDSPQKVLMIATREEGLYVTGEGIACIKSPLNPFYDPEIAKKEAFSFYVNPNLCPFEFACYLHEHRLLPDAGLKSVKGYEYGKTFLENNWDFFVRYFLQDYPHPLVQYEKKRNRRSGGEH